MLSDKKFRRTAKCYSYEKTVTSKTFQPFPTKVYSSESIEDNLFLNEGAFEMPFMLAQDAYSASGIKLPSNVSSLVDLATIIGPTHPVKIIEVAEQNEISGKTMGEYAEYLRDRSLDHKLLNMISLEFSMTALAKHVSAPSFVREIDWIDNIWPLDRRRRQDYPKVQKYCLAGMAGSYTDFHIDFGGTSVWYHILTGQKRFYLIPPTTKNLKIFTQWELTNQQSETFLGDIVDKGQCFMHDLHPGSTFVIPSGWIHAVYTPEDSVVIGGNFVHTFSILRQLQTFEIENRTGVGKIYRFPHFRQIHWYFLCTLLPVARAMYLDDSTEEDLEDEDENVVMMCQQLKLRSVFLQIPILLKVCEMWIYQGQMIEQHEHNQTAIYKDLKITKQAAAQLAEDFGSFSKVAKETRLSMCDGDDDKSSKMLSNKGISTVEEDTENISFITSAWWDVTRRLASHADPTHGLEYVESIYDKKELDILHDADIGQVTPAFDEQLSALFASSGILDEKYNPPKLMISRGEIKGINSSTLETQDHIENKHNAENASGNREGIDRIVNSTEKLSSSSRADCKADDTVAVTALKNSTEKAKTLTGSDKNDEDDDDDWLDFTNDIVSRSREQEETTATTAMLNTDADDNIVDSDDEADGDENQKVNSTKKYGTRGKKLSKSFLMATMDADISDDDEMTGNKAIIRRISSSAANNNGKARGTAVSSAFLDDSGDEEWGKNNQNTSNSSAAVDDTNKGGRYRKKVSYKEIEDGDENFDDTEEEFSGGDEDDDDDDEVASNSSEEVNDDNFVVDDGERQGYGRGASRKRSAPVRRSSNGRGGDQKRRKADDDDDDYNEYMSYSAGQLQGKSLADRARGGANSSAKARARPKPAVISATKPIAVERLSQRPITSSVTNDNSMARMSAAPAQRPANGGNKPADRSQLLKKLGLKM